jgi:hypothetical protein
LPRSVAAAVFRKARLFNTINRGVFQKRRRG